MSQCSRTRFGSCGLIVGASMVPPPPGPITCHVSKRGAGPGVFGGVFTAAAARIRGTSTAKDCRLMGHLMDFALLSFPFDRPYNIRRQTLPRTRIAKPI